MPKRNYSLLNFVSTLLSLYNVVKTSIGKTALTSLRLSEKSNECKHGEIWVNTGDNRTTIPHGLQLIIAACFPPSLSQFVWPIEFDRLPNTLTTTAAIRDVLRPPAWEMSNRTNIREVTLQWGAAAITARTSAIHHSLLTSFRRKNSSACATDDREIVVVFLRLSVGWIQIVLISRIV